MNVLAVLLITTQERADATVIVRIYRVDDLDLFRDGTKADQDLGFSSLTTTIVSCVSNDFCHAE